MLTEIPRAKREQWRCVEQSILHVSDRAGFEEELWKRLGNGCEQAWLVSSRRVPISPDRASYATPYSVHRYESVAGANCTCQYPQHRKQYPRDTCTPHYTHGLILLLAEEARGSAYTSSQTNSECVQAIRTVNIDGRH